MKKSKIIKMIILFALIGFGFIPKIYYYEDGGTIKKQAIFYTIIDYHIGVLENGDYITGHEEYWLWKSWILDFDRVYEQKRINYYRTIGMNEIAEQLESELGEESYLKEGLIIAAFITIIGFCMIPVKSSFEDGEKTVIIKEAVFYTTIKQKSPNLDGNGYLTECETYWLWKSWKLDVKKNNYLERGREE